MKFDPQIHHRRSIRLKGYDYTLPGAYFITIDTWQKEQLFGNLGDGEMHLNQLGRIVRHTWNDLPNHYPHVLLDTFCVMPDHIHGIIVLIDPRQGGSGSQRTLPDMSMSGITPPPAGFETRPYTTSPGHDIPQPKRHGLPEIIRAFKSYSARHINHLRKTPGLPVWQRNYYEHILRGEDDLENTRRYTLNNPLAWENTHSSPSS
jgi:putative transposase